MYVGKKVEKGEVLAELRDDAGEEFERLTEQLEKLREDNAYNIRHLEIDIEIARLSGQDTARMKLQLKQMEEQHPETRSFRFALYSHRLQFLTGARYVFQLVALSIHQRIIFVVGFLLFTVDIIRLQKTTVFARQRKHRRILRHCHAVPVHHSSRYRCHRTGKRGD